MEIHELKKKALFECLNEAEKNLKGTKLDQSLKRVHARDFEVHDEDIAERKITKFHGKESIFVKPDLPITKCLKPRRQPDYQVNPHKWKKYSLADADISDKTNCAAALTFLKEIERQKQNNLENESNEDNGEKIVFKKLSASVSLAKVAEVKATGDAEKPQLKGSKVVMPEYVVGQKTRKSTKKSHPKKDAKGDSSHGNIKLNHLFDEDE